MTAGHAVMGAPRSLPSYPLEKGEGEWPLWPRSDLCSGEYLQEGSTETEKVEGASTPRAEMSGAVGGTLSELRSPGESPATPAAQE